MIRVLARGGMELISRSTRRGAEKTKIAWLTSKLRTTVTMKVMEIL